QSFWIIIAAIIALVVVILVVLWFRGSGRNAFDEIGRHIDNLGDCDKDNVVNMYDKCPCDAVVGEENPDASGCPKDTPANNDVSCCPTE
ncbi:hypothetical protein GOV03_02610, partial [Candidatus Woesearchaeota archaeon]|nr:hypothetical protein [Candidatus Woesearchaeota archaeon]